MFFRRWVVPIIQGSLRIVCVHMDRHLLVNSMALSRAFIIVIFKSRRSKL